MSLISLSPTGAQITLFVGGRAEEVLTNEWAASNVTGVILLFSQGNQTFQQTSGTLNFQLIATDDQGRIVDLRSICVTRLQFLQTKTLFYQRSIRRITCQCQSALTIDLGIPTTVTLLGLVLGVAPVSGMAPSYTAKATAMELGSDCLATPAAEPPSALCSSSSSSSSCPSGPLSERTLDGCCPPSDAICPIISTLSPSTPTTLTTSTTFFTVTVQEIVPLLASMTIFTFSLNSNLVVGPVTFEFVPTYTSFCPPTVRTFTLLS
jgi:hypothetical protein